MGYEQSFFYFLFLRGNKYYYTFPVSNQPQELQGFLVTKFNHPSWIARPADLN
jgi:hypothetical protein